ncbi:MAG: DUF3883 domain-containing protein [Chloroflexi bacterium]|nr:DUF3883 domain-containing protein [Chloroflexota bacterium]
MQMKPENELAMLAAFYLSKFGDEGLGLLGFKTYRQAFEQVGRNLNVNPNSVKNWRDEFDPYYDNGRRGWYQRAMKPSRQKVMATFDNLSEEALRALVLDIITSESRPEVESQLKPVLKEIKRSDDTKRERRTVEYVARGPTGRMAEEFFLSRFRAGLTPFRGVIKDCRDDGVGFDFEVIAKGTRKLVEVKGSAKDLGGIAFTDKEWKVANVAQNDYFLGVVVQVLSSPKIGFLQNPVSTLAAAYHAYTTISVTWTIGIEQLKGIELT